MSDRSTPSDKVLVDPLFAIPEGAEDQFAPTRDEVDSVEIVDSEELVDLGLDESQAAQDFNFEESVDDNGGITLDIPDEFAVISQTLRRAPGGQQVIDIVIQTEDIEGAVNYEIQVTKV